MAEEDTLARKKKIKDALKVVRNASHDELYDFLKLRFKRKAYSPWFSPTLITNHYLLDFQAGLTVCGKYMSNRQSNRQVTLTGDCSICRKRYLKSLERYIHEDIFAQNPDNPLEGFMKMNDVAEKKTRNYSEKKLVTFLAKQILAS